MSFLRPKPSLLLPFFIAVGLLLGLPKIPLLVQFEHLAFPPLERFQLESVYLDTGELSDLRIKVLDFHQPPEHSANIGTYRIDDESREVMGPNEGDPIEWAQFLRQTRLPDDRLVVITSSLSWPDATELPLRALQEQVNLTPCLVVGLRAELLNTEAPLPPELQGSVITKNLPAEFTLPEIDHLTVSPSITAPLFGISEVRGLKIEKRDDSLRIPMLVRWGDNILPSLQLASLITRERLQPSELIIDPTGYLRLGPTGPILQIDRSGYTTLPSSPPDIVSASQLQIYPTRAETTKIIIPTAPPLAVQGLATQLSQALTQKPHLTKTYQRWPLALEIALLVLLASVLQTRRSWIFLPCALLIFTLSIVFSHWSLISPVVLLGASYFLATHLLRQRPKNAPEPEA